MGVVEQNWQALLDQIRQESRGGIIYVIGANDTGKSTLCTYLAENLAQRHLSAYIDCDPGQSLIGPPTTIGLKIPFHSKDTSPSIYLYFVGSTTPRGHLLQTLVGIKKLTEHAQSLGAHWIVLDSSGFVLDPVAREFQFRVIDVLQPRFLIVLQRPDNDLRWTHSYQQHPTIRLFHLEPSRAIISRNPAMRKEYRTLKFKRYFETAVSQDIPLKGISFHGRIPNLKDPSRYRSLLVACCDVNNFVIALGIIQSVDLVNKKIQIYAPQLNPEKIHFLQFGSIYLNLEGQQLFPWRIHELAKPADQNPNVQKGN